MENDGKLEHRQYGEVQLGQKTLQGRETLDKGKDFVNCDIRNLKRKKDRMSFVVLSMTSTSSLYCGK